MTEPQNQVSEPTQADFILASNVATRVQNLITEAGLLARTLGAEITLTQLLGAVLSHGQASADRRITREEFLGVYDKVEELAVILAARQATAQAVTQAAASSAGPEDTAHATTAEQAAKMAARWAEKISEATFEFKIPDLGSDCG